jgi:hypothetical protein
VTLFFCFLVFATTLHRPCHGCCHVLYSACAVTAWMSAHQVRQSGGNEEYLRCNLQERGLQRYQGRCVPAATYTVPSQFVTQCTADLSTDHCNEQVRASWNLCYRFQVHDTWQAFQQQVYLFRTHRAPAWAAAPTAWSLSLCKDRSHKQAQLIHNETQLLTRGLDRAGATSARLRRPV